MPDETDVYQGAAGTGLAWMGPGSTFDPTKFAIDAFNAKVKKKTDEEKQQEEYGKLLDFKPGEQFNIDLNTITTKGIKNLQNYGKTLFQRDKGTTYQNQQEITNAARDLKVQQQELETQYKDWQNVRKIVDSDKGKELNIDKMNRNLAFYENPEAFTETTMFAPYKKGYEEIVTTLEKNPRYQNDPEALRDAARIQFRNQYHNDLLGIVRKPESVFKIIKDNEDALYNTLTKDIEKGGVTVKEISNDRDQRKVPFNDGSEKLIDGTDKTATDLYNGSVDYQRSIKELYSDLPNQDKSKYQGSQDPALEWFKDVVNSTAGDVTTSRRVEKTGNVVNFGNGYSVDTDWLPTEFSSTIKTTRDAANNVYGETDIDGFSVNRGENQLNLDKVVTAPIYYRSNDAAQNAVPTNATSITLAGVKPFMAPTFSKDITFDSFKKELQGMQYDTPIKGKNGETIDNAYDEFLYLFGKKYGNAKKTGSMGGIILTKPEQAFLKKIGKQKYIVGGKFVSGEMSWTESDEYGKPIVKKEPAAIIPLSYVNGDIEAVTKIDFNKALDKYKGKYNNNVTDFNYLKSGNNNNSNTSTTQTTPEETGWGETWSAPKKTPFGKDYDKEDEKGYYFNGRLIEEKGR